MFKELVKPTYKVFEPCYDFFDVMHYLEKKYNFDMYDYAGCSKHHKKCVDAGNAICGDNSWYHTAPEDYTELQQKANDIYEELLKSEPEYQNFWHLYSDGIQGNGSFLYMYFDDEDDFYPDWAKEILVLIEKEFKTDEEDYVKFWVEW